MRTKIASLYLLFFLDLMGMAFVYVILPPLIINTNNMVPQGMSLDTRNLVLGFLLAAYPVATIFAAPVLGDISDRFGRRKILVLSSLVTTISVTCSGIAIMTNNLILLFITRFISGFFAGNTTVAQAAVAESVPVDARESYMARFTMTAGAAWTVGPFLAAILLSSFNFAAPFWALSILFFIVFILICKSVKNTQEIAKGQKLDIHKVLGKLISIFQIRFILVPFIIAVLNVIGWMMYGAFLGPYLIEKFQYSVHWEGYAYAFAALFWLIGGLIAVKVLKKISAIKLVRIPLFISGVSIFCYVFTVESYLIWPLLAISNIFEAICVASFLGTFSRLIPVSNHGKIFGVWSSSWALAGALGPILSGIFVRFYIDLPYVIASMLVLLPAVYYAIWYKKNKSELLATKKKNL